MQAIQTPHYPILFNNDCYSFLQETITSDKYSKVFVVADSNTSQLCLPNFLAQLATEVEIEILEIDAGEINKTIETCTQLWYALTEMGGDRKSIMINVGGGMITDLGGFVSSTFKRGIDFINVPTSLLSMVDASVGGKTGVDLGSLKNQVGVISNPIAVLMDINYLGTLPQNEMRAGLAEMLKHGLICDKTYWEKFLDLNELTTDDLQQLIYESVIIKNNVVTQDPTEKGLRKILNFGHTIGHAIESYHLDTEEKTTLLHGEAIAIGIVMESYISFKKDLLTLNEYTQIKEVITSIFGKTEFDQTDIENIMKLLSHDKKSEFGEVLFVVLNGIGKASFNEPVNNELITEAFHDYLA
ncbi:3-dehydroquinate synthase [Flavobacterium beibuense F44-8]|uniref:3-dehydroquinate synthase n=1 Tax=Flavobacterium beibuense F44-8 TaxID=1406840 RepID=A0A0A2LW16_9FLAO|nr:3-dehydroquinate synthase [Flavobacterium beibuense]KGO83428.1 3-dehydroquinate synthase [Flavobacterium beibuense F44-8]